MLLSTPDPTAVPEPNPDPTTTVPEPNPDPTTRPPISKPPPTPFPETNPQKTPERPDQWPEPPEKGNPMFSKYAGTEINIEGVEHLIIREDDVLGVVE